VSYHNSFKVVTNALTNETYVLHCTTTSPSGVGVPANVKAYIQVPVNNTAVTDIGAIGFLKVSKQKKIDFRFHEIR